MTFRIPTGHHYARPFRLGIWWRKTSFTWVVKFDESCRYDLGNEDQFDTNKLVGIGYLPHHHKNSARFGWRYDIETDRIILSAYCYVNGRRVIQHICFCEIGKEYRIKLQVLANSYYFDAYESGSMKQLGVVFVEHYHRKQFKYGLWSYFGGTSTCDHDVKIQLKRQ
jgi:hypothetical protein